MLLGGGRSRTRTLIPGMRVWGGGGLTEFAGQQQLLSLHNQPKSRPEPKQNSRSSKWSQKAKEGSGLLSSTGEGSEPRLCPQQPGFSRDTAWDRGTDWLGGRRGRVGASVDLADSLGRLLGGGGMWSGLWRVRSSVKPAGDQGRGRAGSRRTGLELGMWWVSSCVGCESVSH